MAISKTYFTGSTASAHYAEVLAWMQENAADYFDEITGDGTCISCNIASITALKLGFANQSEKLFTVTAENGKSVQEYTTLDFTNYRFTSAQKTDGGIFLFLSEVSNIFVTKTNLGSVFFAGVRKASSSNGKIFMCDFSNSAAIAESSTFSYSNFSSSPTSYGIYPTSKTAITNVVSNGGTHCENLFYVPFSQYSGQSDVVIDIDGTKYVYNGIFALKE